MRIDAPETIELVHVAVRLGDPALRAHVGAALGAAGDFAQVMSDTLADVVVTDLPQGLSHPTVALVPAERVEDALRNGAAFALPGTSPPDVIRAAVRAARSGLTGRLRQSPGRLPSSIDGLADEGAALSPRETEVLRLLSQGASNKVIARRLDISVHTAKFHVGSIMTKLGAASRTDAVARGMRLGLVLL